MAQKQGQDSAHDAAQLRAVRGLLSHPPYFGTRKLRLIQVADIERFRAELSEDTPDSIMLMDSYSRATTPTATRYVLSRHQSFTTVVRAMFSRQRRLPISHTCPTVSLDIDQSHQSVGFHRLLLIDDPDSLT